MSVDRDVWRQAEDIFHAALERAAADRPAFLDECCGDAADVRCLVESLLRGDQQHPRFLERPASPAGLPTTDHVASDTGSAARRDPASQGPLKAVIGRRIGIYRILSLLGAGGMGEVYRAHDETLDRDVAIKMLPAEFACDAGRLARFRREARVLASLNHPNIAAIYGLESGTDGDCLVLELVEGETLRGPLPVSAVAELAVQIADALDAAHHHGIVHRDLKPGNVKVTPEGRAKVLDFGLAKAIAGGQPMPAPSGAAAEDGEGTVTGNILGTPGYMSPEQARGEAVDERTDIWAFGCLVYELLTGVRAFDRVGGVGSATTALDAEPDWRALPEDTPARLRDMIKGCLRTDISQRTKSIAETRPVLLEIQLSHARRALASSRAASVDAYELCLRARYHHQQRTPEGFATALRLFEEALGRDPDCALAHAGISHVCLISSYFGGMPERIGIPRLKAAALRAVEVDEKLAVAHVRLGDAFCFGDWDWARAEREFLRALELDPDSPEARCRYGLFLWARQRFDESLIHFRRSLELDPFSLDTNWMIGDAYNSLGRLDEAEETARRMIAMAPRVWLGYHVAAGVRSKQGLWSESALEAEKALALEGGPAGLGWCCWAYACAGRLEDARRLRERLGQMAKERHVPGTWMAMACDAVGEESQARAWLEQAIRDRHMMLVHLRSWGDYSGVLVRFRHLLDEHDL
jgi:serine/threonine protein kinase